MSKKKIAINGFGRIGRLVFRAYIERVKEFNETFEIAYINDLADIDSNIHLLKYDSVHGALNQEINKTAENKFSIGDNEITVTSERNPVDLKWGDKGVDIILECTGVFASKEKAMSHIESGANKVIVSAPCTNADFTVVQGVNHQDLNNDHVVISNASCTTNCLSPVAYVVDKEFGIENGYMTTIHSYTGDQRKNPISVDTLNAKFKEYANGTLKGILGVDTDPKVSSDYNHDSHSSILDLTETTTVSDTFGRILTWYDNEWGFSNRMLETSQQVCKL